MIPHKQAGQIDLSSRDQLLLIMKHLKVVSNDLDFLEGESSKRYANQVLETVDQ
jgi:hypothetical protein